jgi:hypothetical protein
MAGRSQNRWPIVAKVDCDTAPLIRDVTVPNGVLAGDVALIFRWLAGEYDRRVERLKRGECWGWFVKTIEGSASISNHASATAVDFNAPDNPMGRGTTAKSMTGAQIRTCHELEQESDDVLRWGGDYLTRQDPMHWEIVGSAAAVRRFAGKLRNAPEPREVAKMIMTVSIPLLRQGDDDAKLGGYNVITRIQRIVGATDDGIWGPATTKAIAAWCKIAAKDADTLSEDIARKILGLA